MLACGLYEKGVNYNVLSFISIQKRCSYMDCRIDNHLFIILIAFT